MKAPKGIRPPYKDLQSPAELARARRHEAKRLALRWACQGEGRGGQTRKLGEYLTAWLRLRQTAHRRMAPDHETLSETMTPERLAIG